MAMQSAPFAPQPQSQVNIAVTNASQALTIAPPQGGGSMRCVNDGTDKIAWRYGSTAATIAADVVMLPNTVEVFDLPGGITSLAVIGATGGLSTFRVTLGQGA